MKSILSLTIALLFFLAGCTSTGQRYETPYVIEITTFNYKSDVNAETFWMRDAEIQADYTSKQPGFLKRESGVSEEGEVIVVVYWKTQADASASMEKFMQDASVADYAGMIDGSTMKMTRYMVR